MGASEERIVYRDQLLTTGDLATFKSELLGEIQSLLANHLAGKRMPAKKWLRSEEVKAMLGISAGKLFILRKKGILPFTRIDKVFFYDADDIEKMLTSRKSLGNDQQPVDNKSATKKEKGGHV
jgi:hypothetical protein